MRNGPQLVLVVALASAGACKQGTADTTKTSMPSKPSASTPTPSKPSAPVPSAPTPSEPNPPTPAAERPAPHLAPSGTVQGVAFAPDTVRLEETSDGTILELTKLRADRRDRVRCEGTELSAERELQVYLSEEIVKSGKGAMEIGSFSGTDIAFHNPVPGTAKIELTKRDAAAFRVEGTIELASDDGKWKLAGPFAGEYCPTKVIRRESPAPLLGQPWTLAAVAPAKLVAEPIQAIVAGAPARIELVTLREAKKHDGKLLQRLVFYTRPRKDPCAERPYGGGGSLAPEPNDSFAIDLAVAPAKGATLAGRHDGDTEQTSQIDGADLRVFEPDGYRSWIYSQYFSATLAFDELDDKAAKGRVFLAVPDTGKSMLVGAFQATRCPPEP
jgi:hypothetical protein